MSFPCTTIGLWTSLGPATMYLKCYLSYKRCFPNKAKTMSLQRMLCQEIPTLTVVLDAVLPQSYLFSTDPIVMTEAATRRFVEGDNILHGMAALTSRSSSS